MRKLLYQPYSTGKYPLPANSSSLNRSSQGFPQIKHSIQSGTGKPYNYGIHRERENIKPVSSSFREVSPSSVLKRNGYENRPKLYFKPGQPQIENRSQNSYRNFHNKTFISQNKMDSISDGANYFSEDLYDIMRNQQSYIGNLRRKIQVDKKKASADIEIFKKELINTIEDYRLSLMAQLDAVFKQYMQMYSKVKQNLHDMKNTKDQLKRNIQEKQQNWSMSIDSLNLTRNKIINTSRVTKNQQKMRKIIDGMSNPDYKNMPMVVDDNISVIRAIEENNEEYRKFHLMKHIDQVCRDNVIYIQSMVQQIVLINEYDNGFYISEEMGKILNQCKKNVKQFWSSIYNKTKTHLRCISEIINVSNIINCKQDDILEPEHHSQLQLVKQNQNHRQQYNHPQNQIFAEREINHQISPSMRNNRFNQYDVSTVSIAPSQQIAIVPSMSLPTVRFDKTLNVNHSKQICLCVITLPTNQIAIGSRDGSIGIYSIQTGLRTQRLEGHKASVCSLALLKSFSSGRCKYYLASGSDHDCNSVIVWNIEQWMIKWRVQGHKAAVTSILDLADGLHLISGSYDKKINIYDMQSGRIEYNLPTNKCSVTGIIMNRSQTRVISCGLDFTLSIWQIVRKEGSSELRQTKNVVETLFLQRIIQNNTMICSLVSSNIRDQIVYIGTKDGEIKIINIYRGDCEQTLVCCQDGAALIEMVVIQRVSKPKYPIIIAFACQQSSMRLVDTQNSSLTNLNSKVKTYLQFGCGVGPKCIFIEDHSNLQFGVLSHGPQKQFNIYSINL